MPFVKGSGCPEFGKVLDLEKAVNAEKGAETRLVTIMLTQQEDKRKSHLSLPVEY